MTAVLESVTPDLDEIPETVSDVESPESGPLSCDLCGLVVKSGTERGLKRHMTIAHGTGGDRTPDSAGRKAKKSLEDDLGSMLNAFALAVSMFNAADGMTVATHADSVARAWSNLAMKNPKVDRILRNMMGGVSYGEVVVATAMMVIPILANHGLLPAQMVAVFPAADDS